MLDDGPERDVTPSMSATRKKNWGVAYSLNRENKLCMGFSEVPPGRPPNSHCYKDLCLVRRPMPWSTGQHCTYWLCLVEETDSDFTSFPSRTDTAKPTVGQAGEPSSFKHFSDFQTRLPSYIPGCESFSSEVYTSWQSRSCPITKWATRKFLQWIRSGYPAVVRGNFSTVAIWWCRIWKTGNRRRFSEATDKVTSSTSRY